MNVIETERLTLRPLESSDANLVMRIFSDPAAMAFAPIPVTTDIAAANRFIRWQLENYEKHGAGARAVIQKSDELFIGLAGLIPQEIGVEVYYAIVSGQWNRGFATEAAMASRDYGLNELGLNRLISVIHPKNERAIRVAEKIGMHKAGTVQLFGREDLLFEFIKPA